MSERDGRQAKPQKQQPKRRWGRTILIVSLAVNLLFLGAIIGAGWMRRHHHSGNWQGPPDYVVKRLLRHLPEDKQRSISDQISNHGASLAPKFKDIKSRQQELKRRLYEEPFHAHRVREAATALKMSRHQFVDAKTELLISVLGQLTSVERQQLLKSRLFRHLFKRRSRWGSRHH